MNEALERINQIGRAEAEYMFRDCCGSAEWAKRVAASRPFASENALFESAVAIWNGLETVDWLEAFSAHPKIGETKSPPARQSRSAEWSAGEQAGVNSADEMLRQELVDANREYYEKFGFIFIVCATGKEANEMLELCRARLGNDRETEIAIAAKEQQKITELRLKKLLLM